MIGRQELGRQKVRYRGTLSDRFPPDAASLPLTPHQTFTPPEKQPWQKDAFAWLTLVCHMAFLTAANVQLHAFTAQSNIR
jgi:hypothetical protein